MAALALAAGGGCIGVGIDGPRRLESALRGIDGAEMTRVVGLSVGGALVDTALRLAANETGMRFDAGRVERVQLAVYRVDRGADRSLVGELEVDDLVPFVTVRDGGDEVRIFAELDGGDLAGLSVVVHDGSDLVALRLEGDLGPLAAEAMTAAIRDHAPPREPYGRLARR